MAQLNDLGAGPHEVQTTAENEKDFHEPRGPAEARAHAGEACKVLTAFLVDENLAQLTRWLRFFGFDAVAVKGISDIEVARKAKREGRVLLTRDRDFRAIAPHFWLNTDDLRAQLVAIVGIYGVPEEHSWFTRCSACNESLSELNLQEIETASVPLIVKRGESPCWRCASCSRVYWRGTHFERIRAFLRSVRAA